MISKTDVKEGETSSTIHQHQQQARLIRSVRRTRGYEGINQLQPIQADRPPFMAYDPYSHPLTHLFHTKLHMYDYKLNII